MSTITKTEDTREVEFAITDGPVVRLTARTAYRVERVKVSILWDIHPDTSEDPETIVSVVIRPCGLDGTPLERSALARELYDWRDHPEVAALVTEVLGVLAEEPI